MTLHALVHEVENSYVASHTHIHTFRSFLNIGFSSCSFPRRHEQYSTGRGGAGNIHRSVSGTRQGITDDIGTPARGREPPAGATTTGTGDRITHVGRGGAGNVRSPSREPRDASEFFSYHFPDLFSSESLCRPTAPMMQKNVMMSSSESPRSHLRH